MAAQYTPPAGSAANFAGVGATVYTPPAGNAANFAEPPVTVVHQIAASGGDYTSLSAWEAAQQRDLTAVNEIAVAECQAFEDTSQCTVDGWTTGATRNIIIRAAAGAEARLPWSTSAYRMKVGFAEYGVRFLELFGRVERISVWHDGPRWDNGGGIRWGPDAHDGVFIIDGCVAQNSDAGGAQSNGTSGFSLGSSQWRKTGLVRNCVAYGFAMGFDHSWEATEAISNIQFINCTAYGDDAQQCGLGFRVDDAVASTVRIINCLSTHTFVSDFQFGVGAVVNNCASQDATATGTGSRASQTFTFVNAAAGDYRLAAGDAGAKGFGADLSADAVYPFTTDLDGLTRTVPWDIGALISEVGSAMTELASILRFTQRAAPAIAVAGTDMVSGKIRAEARTASAVLSATTALPISVSRTTVRNTGIVLSSVAGLFSTARLSSRIRGAVATATADLTSRLRTEERTAASRLTADTALRSTTRSAERSASAVLSSTIEMIASKTRTTLRILGSSAFTGAITALVSSLRLSARILGSRLDTALALRSTERSANRETGSTLSSTTAMPRSTLRSEARTKAAVLSLTVQLQGRPIVLTSRLSGAQAVFYEVVQLRSTSRLLERSIGARLTADTALSSQTVLQGRLTGSRTELALALGVSRLSVDAILKSSRLYAAKDLTSGKIRMWLRVKGSTYVDSTNQATYGLLPLDAFFTDVEGLADFTIRDDTVTFLDANGIADWEN